MFIKPTKSFRLSKQSKRLAATFVDAHDRGYFRRMMIQAQLQGATVFKREKDDTKSTK